MTWLVPALLTWVAVSFGALALYMAVMVAAEARREHEQRHRQRRFEEAMRRITQQLTR
jgi:type II secretory pathway component PulJ